MNRKIAVLVGASLALAFSQAAAKAATEVHATAPAPDNVEVTIQSGASNVSMTTIAGEEVTSGFRKGGTSHDSPLQEALTYTVRPAPAGNAGGAPSEFTRVATVTQIINLKRGAEPYVLTFDGRAFRVSLR